MEKAAYPLIVIADARRIGENLKARSAAQKKRERRKHRKKAVSVVSPKSETEKVSPAIVR